MADEVEARVVAERRQVDDPHSGRHASCLRGSDRRSTGRRRSARRAPRPTTANGRGVRGRAHAGNRTAAPVGQPSALTLSGEHRVGHLDQLGQHRQHRLVHPVDRADRPLGHQRRRRVPPQSRAPSGSGTDGAVSVEERGDRGRRRRCRGAAAVSSAGCPARCRCRLRQHRSRPGRSRSCAPRRRRTARCWRAHRRAGTRSHSADGRTPASWSRTARTASATSGRAIATRSALLSTRSCRYRWNGPRPKSVGRPWMLASARTELLHRDRLDLGGQLRPRTAAHRFEHDDAIGTRPAECPRCADAVEQGDRRGDAVVLVGDVQRVTVEIGLRESRHLIHEDRAGARLPTSPARTRRAPTDPTRRHCCAGHACRRVEQRAEVAQLAIVRQRPPHRARCADRGRRRACRGRRSACRSRPCGRPRRCRRTCAPTSRTRRPSATTSYTTRRLSPTRYLTRRRLHDSMVLSRWRDAAELLGDAVGIQQQIPLRKLPDRSPIPRRGLAVAMVMNSAFPTQRPCAPSTG